MKVEADYWKAWTDYTDPCYECWALGADGISITEQADKNDYVVCTKYKDFKTQASFQRTNMFAKNQYVKGWRSLGKAGMAPNTTLNSNAYISLLDDEGLGVICVWDEFWIGLTWYGTNTNTNDSHFVFDIYFRPRQINRQDLMMAMIRDRCSRTCDKDVLEVQPFPCPTPCWFANTYADGDKVKIPISIGEEKEITGKEWNEKIWPPGKTKTELVNNLKSMDVCDTYLNFHYGCYSQWYYNYRTFILGFKFEKDSVAQDVIADIHLLFSNGEMEGKITETKLYRATNTQELYRILIIQVAKLQDLVTKRIKGFVEHDVQVLVKRDIHTIYTFFYSFFIYPIMAYCIKNANAPNIFQQLTLNTTTTYSWPFIMENVFTSIFKLIPPTPFQKNAKSEPNAASSSTPEPEDSGCCSESTGQDAEMPEASQVPAEPVDPVGDAEQGPEDV